MSFISVLGDIINACNAFIRKIHIGKAMCLYMIAYCVVIFFLAFCVSFFEVDKDGIFYELVGLLFKTTFFVFPPSLISLQMSLSYKFLLMNDPEYKWIARDYPVFRVLIWPELLPGEFGENGKGN